MKTRSLLLMLGFVIAIGSCTTAYKTGQTPDDVYSSPVPPEEEYVSTKKTDERRYRNYDRDEYADYEDYDDRYLRMKVRNRDRWSDLDDWYYYGGRYNFSYYNNWYYWNDPFYWNSPWSPVSYWNMYYNPYWYGGGMYSGWGMGMYSRWGFYDPWYSPWYGGWGGMYAGWGGFYDPWYTGWYGNPYWYGYGPGVIGGRSVAYGQRRANLGSYNQGMRNTTGTASNTGYRSTYGVRTNSSVNTNTTNSNERSRVASRRFGTSDGNYNPRSSSIDNGSYSTPGRNVYSTPSQGRSSGSSSGGVSGGSSGGSSGGAGGRRF